MANVIWRNTEAYQALQQALQKALDEGRIGNARAELLRGPPQHFLTPDQLEWLREAETIGWLVVTPEGVDDAGDE